VDFKDLTALTIALLKSSSTPQTRRFLSCKKQQLSCFASKPALAKTSAFSSDFKSSEVKNLTKT